MDVEFRGYYPGVVRKIIESHAVYYFENWGFDVTFETQVGRELSEFVFKFDNQSLEIVYILILLRNHIFEVNQTLFKFVILAFKLFDS